MRAGYFDTTTGNEGGVYRTDVDVDIKALGAGYTVGWMNAGEWLEYTVNVPVAGDYNAVLSVGAVDAGRTLELSECGTSLTGPIPIPQIAAWGDMSTTTVGPVHLSAGLQVIRVTMGAIDYVDFDSMTFESAGGNGGSGGTNGTGGSGGVMTCDESAIGSAPNTLSINVDSASNVIAKEIFGLLMERLGRDINGGVYVGTNSSIPNTDGMRTDIVDGFKEAGVGCIQWPGGCAANGYNWSPANPSGDMGTDKFLELCALVGAEPYITGRPYASDATSNQQWATYINNNPSHPEWSLKYFKVGNEVWGCGGNQNESTYESGVIGWRPSTTTRTRGCNRLPSWMRSPRRNSFTYSCHTPIAFKWPEWLRRSTSSIRSS